MDSRPEMTVWRIRAAVLIALALVAAGLFVLERTPASAAPGPRVVPAAARPLSAAGAQVAPLRSVSSQLRGAASLLTQSLPDIDAVTAASTTDAAASANQAAGLSQQLAGVLTSTSRDAPARAVSTAGQLQAALAATQAKADSTNRLPITLPIQFCNFTIQIGPIVIDIPRLHIHIVIGPFFIHFRAPCFLSGIIPTHVPPPTTTTTSTPPICMATTGAGTFSAAAKCPKQMQFPIRPAPHRLDSVTMCVILVGANLTTGACDPVTTMGGAHVVQVVCTGTGPVSGTVQVEDPGGVTRTSTWSGRCDP